MLKYFWTATTRRLAENILLITACNMLCVSLAIGVSLWLGVLKFGADDDTGRLITAIRYVTSDQPALPPSVGYTVTEDPADFAARQRMLGTMKDETLQTILLVRTSWMFSTTELIREAEHRKMLPPGIVNLEELEPIK